MDDNVNFTREWQPNDQRSIIDALAPHPVNGSYLLSDKDKEQISGLGGDLSVIDDTEFKYDEHEDNLFVSPKFETT